ncbi:YebC/PmpR family DNA-binding transcriptional regulator [Candidatus Gottesmanbacteria bacterium]|nr:YebC/PmpR family DNA-binding transcriptional regulator [Candidatus Gottesmanbacteria bacterium]
MSGHSKWSKVKHQKAVTDSVKGREFTKAARAITTAVREGGGVSDPDGNFRLRLAIEKARDVNMPKVNIDRAIARAKGEDTGSFETILYEGFGPGGVAILIEAATDNRQRTVSILRNILEVAGGSLGGNGSVSYLFDTVGIIIASKDAKTFDTMMTIALEVGASDCLEESDAYVLFTDSAKLFTVRAALEKQGIGIVRADIVKKPKITVAVTESDKSRIDLLVNAFEDLDDVGRVFTNVEY